MGSSCSSVEASSKKSLKQSLVSTEPFSLKTHKALKERYTTLKGPKKDNERLFNVRNTETQCDYVCRRIPRNWAPCKDLRTITSHFRSLNGLEHPHTCKFVEGFEDPEAFYLIYEKSDPTTLFKYIQTGESFAEEDAAEYTRQICMALAVASEQGLCHGRLSPTKVIIVPEDREMGADEDEEDVPPAQVKICDMGQGFILREGCLLQLRQRGEDGLPAPKQELLECMPPEVAWEEVAITDFANTGANSAIIHKLDVWSLGCIVYHMLTGVPPHCASSPDALVERMKTQGVEYGEEWSELTVEARDAVESMLKVNAGLRPTASALLRHPWLRMPRARLPKVRLLRLLRNIRANASEGHFKRMVMRVIAQQLPIESREVDNLEQAFRFFDRNGDGVLGVDEICQCVAKMQLDPGMGQLSKLEETMQLLDRDGSSTVNLQEFVAGALNPKLTSSLPKLWAAFNAFDVDSNGSVTVDEIEAIVRNVEAGLLAKEQVDGLVREIRDELRRVVDKDVDFDQFVYIMTTPTGKQEGSTLKRNLYRSAYSLFGVDCYEVRKYTPPDWNWQHLSQSAPSAYRRSNLVVVRRNQMDATNRENREQKERVQSPKGGSSESRNRSSRGRQPGQTAKR